MAVGDFILEGVAFYSESLEKAKAFYRDLLGLPLLLEEDHVLHFDAGSVRLAIHRYPSGEKRQGSEGFVVFAVDDLVATYDQLVRRGAEFSGPPAVRPYGRVAYLRDPEGHEIAFVEEPRKDTDAYRRIAPLVDRHDRVAAKLNR
jgi:lactoylglutathione lyase